MAQKQQQFTRCFPRLLHFVLGEGEEKKFTNIITWAPDGDEFHIADGNAFMNEVAPIYFGNQSNIQSFYRQLNLWGFDRVGKTRQKSSTWRHAIFHRDKPECITSMQRFAVKDITRPRTIKTPPVAMPRAATNGNANKKRRASTSTQKKPKENRAGAESCAVATRDTTNNVTGNILDSESPQIAGHADPLLDERLHYELHLGQDFESFMSSSDKLVGSWESNYSAIDTGIDLTTVFQM